uniref:H15 domain-containing protein n=1 Tax=Cuerna arida TaxID=1464854 RepID=A0A1B6FUL2_9HEMI
MRDLFRCHEAAVREVISVVGMMGERKGSTATDIYFVLENVHGRVKRQIFQKALQSAVIEGLLSCKNRRYKITSAKVPPVPKLPKVRPESSYGFRTDSDRSFGFRINDTPRRRRYARSISTRSYSTGESYRPRHMSSITTCKCDTSTSEDSRITTEVSSRSTVVTPKRIWARRHPRGRYRYPMPKKAVKVEHPSTTRVPTESQVSVEQHNDENKSSGTADEEIKTIIKKTIDEINMDGDVKNVQVLMDVDPSNKLEESKSSGDSKSSTSQNTDDAKTSEKSQAENSSSSELDTTTHKNNSEKVSDEVVEMDYDDILHQPSCSHFDPNKEIILIDSSEDEKVESAPQKQEFRYQTRSRAKAEKHIRPPSTSSNRSRVSYKKSKNIPQQIREGKERIGSHYTSRGNSLKSN